MSKLLKLHILKKLFDCVKANQMSCWAKQIRKYFVNSTKLFGKEKKILVKKAKCFIGLNKMIFYIQEIIILI